MGLTPYDNEISHAPIKWDVHPSIVGCCFEHMFYVVKYCSSSWGNQRITIQLARDEWWMVNDRITLAGQRTKWAIFNRG